MCEPGTEYLAADPVTVPGLADLIQTCVQDTLSTHDVAFDVHIRAESGHDPFLTLAPEICHELLGYLARAEVGKLRLVSRSFSQLPQAYFCHLIEDEMPWMWETEGFKGQSVDWQGLWCKLSLADGGANTDTKERQWLKEVQSKKSKRLHDELGAKGISLSGNTLEFRAKWDELYPKVKAEADAEIKAGYDARMWLPRKSGVLLGLRNRRRIWEDTEEIVRRIQALPPDDTA